MVKLYNLTRNYHLKYGTCFSVLFDYMNDNEHRVGQLNFIVDDNDSRWINEEYRKSMRIQANTFIKNKRRLI